jgi:hypothetical protein
VRQGDQNVSTTVSGGVDGRRLLDYGLPGKPGYRYTRPFDYFHFELTTVDSSYAVENTMTRGLLLGTKYALGDAYRGIWGLYGSYDYISPQVFRVSTTALSLGTTAQWWLSRAVALQGTALGGIGFGAAGTIAGAGERDYHYGTTPQAPRAPPDPRRRGDVRLHRARLLCQQHGFPETQDRSASPAGTRRSPCAHGRHAIGIQYVASQRDAHYRPVDRHQTVGTVSPRTTTSATPTSAPSSGATPTAAERVSRAHSCSLLQEPSIGNEPEPGKDQRSNTPRE